MSRYCGEKQTGPILDAAARWRDVALLSDAAVFADKPLWTVQGLEALDQHFVQNPDEGEGTFLNKLKGFLEPTEPYVKQLAAEMSWLMMLCPSNTLPPKKRETVEEIWGWSGERMPPMAKPWLTDAVLGGIGSAGVAFIALFWRELTFCINTCLAFKRLALAKRQELLQDPWKFAEWLQSIPDAAARQLRHMLLYLLFPDNFERIFGRGDRQFIFQHFSGKTQGEARALSPLQLDREFARIRADQQKKYPGQNLDFYMSPLKEQWKRETAGDDEADERGSGSDLDHPVNLILYGPPGTGKTHWLRQKFADYTDAPATVDRETWLQELLANYGWRPVIAAAIADLGRVVRVPEIRDHPWVQAKARQRGRTVASVHTTLWGFLQEHTPETVTTVKSSGRRPPFIFSKRESSEWELLPDWQELDEESAELQRLLKAGPGGAKAPIRRYRVVTFHPSFSYEDFVRGIRPVPISEDGATQFRMVDGNFKQICDEARANPAKRYALFIDEINRANIAKVFGELITLIETDKRALFDSRGQLMQGMAVQLPGGDGTDVSEPPFGVPPNLDIYGTMNTADRSIALLDIALRRRFEFQEMEPDYTQIDRLMGEVNLGQLLRRVNDRLEYLLDRDHRIGHAYLMPVKVLADLRRVFRVQIIPMLQEYFFDDLSRVAMVLAINSAAPQFVSRERLGYSHLFASARSEGLPDERLRYVVTAESTWTEASFCGVYLAAGSTAEDEDPA